MAVGGLFFRRAAMKKGLLSTSEVAELLNVTVRTVRGAVADGRLPVVRVWRGPGGRSLVRFRREDIEKLISERTEPAKSI